jgi:hypothetical protein
MGKEFTREDIEAARAEIAWFANQGLREEKLSRRRDELTNLYTNVISYESLGLGLKAAIDHIIDLEDELEGAA